MPIFQTLSGTSFDESQILDTIETFRASEPARLDQLPDGYTVINEDMLKYSSSLDGYMDSQGYFHGEGASSGGQAIALLNDDGTISISFRGANDFTDLSAFWSFGSESYISGFEDWMSSVSNFADENGYEIDLVVGYSLGGATVNMLSETSDEFAGGAYSDAQFIALASPWISSSSDNIVNYGHSNDYAHEWHNEIFGSGFIDRETVTDNITYYNKEYHQSDWTGRFDFSSHGFNSIADGMLSISNSQFHDDMEQDDYIVLIDNDYVDMSRANSRTNADEAGTAYVIGTNDRNITLKGSELNENIELGDGNDKIIAKGGDDIIYTGGGRNAVNAGSGDDQVYGGNLNDKINGGSGDDVLDGGSGSDKVNGGSGDDELHGGWGRDRLYGGNGHDVIYGDQHADMLYGGKGDDELYGGEGNDQLHGGKGDDELYGGEGNDQLYGGKQDDLLDGGEGNDTMYGQKGNDTFVVNGRGHDEIMDFNLGQDVLHFDNSEFPDMTIYDLSDSVTITDDGFVQINVDENNFTLLNGVTIEYLETYAEENDAENWEELIFVS